MQWLSAQRNDPPMEGVLLTGATALAGRWRAWVPITGGADAVQLYQ